MALSAEAERKYVEIIDAILASSDLNTISEKRIRKGLQQAVNHDLTPQKDVIKALIIARFDKFMADQSAPPATNGHVAEEKPSGSPEDLRPPIPNHVQKHESVDAEDSSEIADATVPSRKRKRSPIDEDAAFAAKLQAEENGRARSTRGGGSKKAAPLKKKKTPQKKTAHRVEAVDDSDLESEPAEKNVNRNSGFHLSRPQTVKRIWEYVRRHNLQEPSDKRQIRCDDKMRAVFRTERVNMFKMNKLLGQNFYSPDE
ncbi:MAG: hypothetical protein Q9219_005114 [cf. Caloplaca sp. 3 TL-2023]